MDVYDCVCAMGLLRAILTENVNENKLATRQSAAEGAVALGGGGTPL